MRAMTSTILALTLFAGAAAQADTLLVQRVASEATANMPKRGATMATVQTQYGAPTSKHGAVGKPPITRWDYPGFTVYFEYSHVVDTVASKASPEEMGAKPVTQPVR
jgi:hypothetical protein